MLLDKKYFPSEEWQKTVDLREAIMHYKKALAIEYKASPLFGLGIAYSRLEQYSDAIDAYTKSITLAPDNSSRVYLYRAWCYTRLNMKDKASKDLKKAAAMTPDEKFKGYPVFYTDSTTERTYHQIAYPEKYNSCCILGVMWPK